MTKLKKAALAGAALISLRLSVLGGAGEELRTLIYGLMSGERIISATINLELGGFAENGAGTDSASEQTFNTPPVIFISPGATSTPQPGEAPEEDEREIVETTIYSGLTITNGTDYDIDITGLMSEGLALSLASEGPQILIIHTHGSEAYSPEGQDFYTPTDTDRTEDTRYNVVRVGDELAAALESFGLNVLHDRSIYDYPSYSGSYSRSGEAVERYLAENPGISVVIDLHRDALGSGDVVYKTKAELEGECSSQVMLLVGTDESGLSHPGWRENLKLALYLQQAMVREFPTLTRPIALTPQRYNQHFSAGSLILEVGSSGNTLQEALTAVRLFAASAGPALLGLVSETEA